MHPLLNVSLNISFMDAAGNLDTDRGTGVRANAVECVTNLIRRKIIQKHGISPAIESLKKLVGVTHLDFQTKPMWRDHPDARDCGSNSTCGGDMVFLDEHSTGKTHPVRMSSSRNNCRNREVSVTGQGLSSTGDSRRILEIGSTNDLDQSCSLSGNPAGKSRQVQSRPFERQNPVCRSLPTRQGHSRLESGAIVEHRLNKGGAGDSLDGRGHGFSNPDPRGLRYNSRSNRGLAHASTRRPVPRPAVFAEAGLEGLLPELRQLMVRVHAPIINELPGETHMIPREPEGRAVDQIRPVTIETNFNRYAEGSVLIRAGHTHVLCTASVEESVPGWLKGKGQGWVTAEYSMLPRSTHTRSKRDREKISGRTHEIQRLIGRALRMTVDLGLLGERSVLIDCDVIQADGGTRTASITGACVALGIALNKLIVDGKIPAATWIDTVSAISLGIVKDQILTDLDYNEDSGCEADTNFVVTGSGKLVEVQGTAESVPFSAEKLMELTSAAMRANRTLREIQIDALRRTGVTAIPGV